MTLIDIDSAKYAEKKVEFKLDGKTYTATNDDKIIKGVMKSYAQLMLNNRKFSMQMKVLDEEDKKKKVDVGRVEDDAVKYAVNACHIQIKLIDALFGAGVGDLLYKHFDNSTQRLLMFLEDVLNELMAQKSNNIKHKKAKKVK